MNLTSSSSVEIHWDYPGGQFEDLSFSVTALYHGPCPESVPPLNVPVPSPDERSIVVQNLEAHSMYSFVLSAVNSAGSSAIESAMIHTLPSGKTCMSTLAVFWFLSNRILSRFKFYAIRTRLVEFLNSEWRHMLPGHIKFQV